MRRCKGAAGQTARATFSLLLCFVGTLVWSAAATAAQPPAKGNFSKLVFPAPDGKLQYAPDEDGNVIPDFSNAGYGGGGVRIPDVAVKVTLTPSADRQQDDTQRIQRAIDDVSKMPLDAGGFRGAVLLRRGTYRVGGQLRISASGVVLRGEGDGENGTILLAAGNKARDLIQIAGRGDLREIGSTSRKIIDEYVPVGARSFTVGDGSGLKVGDTVIVRRVGNAAWISEIGMDRIQGRPGNESSTKQWGPFDLLFDRVIAAIDGSTITVDAPITCAIEQRWGGGSVVKYVDEGRIANCGVERLRAVSEYDRSVTAERNGKPYPSDEDHAVYLLSFDHVKNAWGRQITTVHFAHGPAAIRGGAKWVTVEDARSLAPVSVITGGRRYPYLFAGQLSMFQRCYSQHARHAFAVGSRVCGPNVFLDCTSEEDYATSEPHHRWSVGGLYDNVRALIAFQDRQWMGSGHGWAGANYVAWNCEGSLVSQKPPTAQNWAIGFVGKKEKGAFAGRQDGWWESHGKHVEPRSLYLKQLEDRAGRQAVQNVAARNAR